MLTALRPATMAQPNQRSSAVQFGKTTPPITANNMDGAWMRDLFIDIAKMDTRSDHTAPSDGPVPSTPSQMALAEHLKPIMEKAGLKDVAVSKQAIVSGVLPTNQSGNNIPTIALLAHLDLAHDAKTDGIEPLVHQYTGGDINLPKEGTVIPAKDLKHSLNHEVITSSGDTLLGGDNKGGLVEILEAIRYLKKHPDLPRPNIKVAFTPDEEIGRSLGFLDLDSFGADAAYTIDGGTKGGGQPSEINYETFNAHSVKVSFDTNNLTHKAQAFAEFVRLLPKDTAPETTEDYEGYLHPIDGMGIGVESAGLTLTVDNPDVIKHIEKVVETVKEQIRAKNLATGNDRTDEFDITLTATKQPNQYQLQAKGVVVHAGYANNIMINAIRALADVVHHTFTPTQTLTKAALNKAITVDTFGDQTATDAAHPLHLLVRDFDYDESLKKVNHVKGYAKQVDDAFGRKVAISTTASESYQNMKTYIEEKNPSVIQHAIEGIRRTFGADPTVKPIRGGTDGSGLSLRGLPTPNLPSGQNNIHSKTEFITVDDMKACAANIANIMVAWGESLQPAK